MTALADTKFDGESIFHATSRVMAELQKGPLAAEAASGADLEHKPQANSDDLAAESAAADRSQDSPQGSEGVNVSHKAVPEPLEGVDAFPSLAMCPATSAPSTSGVHLCVRPRSTPQLTAGTYPKGSGLL